MMLDRDLFEFFEHTADAAFTVSDSGEICSWNASAERLFGFARAEAIGKTCSELFQGRDVLGTLVCTDHCHLRDCEQAMYEHYGRPGYWTVREVREEHLAAASAKDN